MECIQALFVANPRENPKKVGQICLDAWRTIISKHPSEAFSAHSAHDWKLSMNIDIDKLDAIAQELKGTLKEGLLATDIWDRATGLSLAGINPQPAAVALFTEMTNTLHNALSDAGFPGLKRYFFLDLEGDHVVMIIRHGNDLLQGILMNSQKVNLGLLLSVALPKMLAGVEKART